MGLHKPTPGVTDERLFLFFFFYHKWKYCMCQGLLTNTLKAKFVVTGSILGINLQRAKC